MRQGVKGECAGTTVAEKVPSVADAKEALAQAEAYCAHKEFAAAILAGYEAAAAAARVPLYKRLVDLFTPEQVLWEFENLFVLSGLTNGAWSELAREFDGLNRAEPRETAACAMLDRARAFSEFCAGFWAEPIKFKDAPAAPAAAE